MVGFFFTYKDGFCCFCWIFLRIKKDFEIDMYLWSNSLFIHLLYAVCVCVCVLYIIFSNFVNSCMWLIMVNQSKDYVCFTHKEYITKNTNLE